MISQESLFLIGLVYLAILFSIAYVAERGLIPKKIIEHPLTLVLSLGVYAGAWSIYGAFGFAQESGYNYLTFYLGLSAAYFFAPILLRPIFRITKTFQLHSLADVFTFRYRSPFLGKMVTVLMIVAITPILAAQIQAVSTSIQYISSGTSKDQLAIGYCILITLFTIIFGAQHFNDKDKKNDGLVAAIAFESLLKLLAMLVIAGFCIFEVFGGFAEMQTWLRNNPKHVNAMFTPMINGNWPTLILIFFAASFTMPHMYHMAFSENRNEKNFHTAAWGLPVYLLLMAVCIPPILWAGIHIFQNDNIAFDYIAIGISHAQNSQVIALLVYIAGISAASGIIIVSTLALASMSVNHLVLPIANAPTTGFYLYTWLRWQRYTLIAAIIAVAYLVYRTIDNQQTLSQLMLLAYTASVQLFPALFGVLFWKGANRFGVLLGLIAGFGIWLIAFYLPLLIELDPLGLFKLLGIDISYVGIQLNNRDWHFITISAVIINFGVMFLVSLLTPTSEDEAYAADQCAQDLFFSRQKFRQLDIDSAHEFKIRLSKPLGSQIAEQELSTALKELGINRSETRPHMLQKLRNRIETNLSRLLGVARTQEILNTYIPFSGSESETEDLYTLEGRLEEYQYRLTGLAAELNNLRRFHRQTLIDLPIGVCAISHDNEIVTWNIALEDITQLKSSNMLGTYLHQAQAPWGNLFKEFLASTDTHWHRKKITIHDEIRWINLHKASISEQGGSGEQTDDKHSARSTGLAFLIEDMTNLIKLEAKLTHSERLASIGRMAAGVAHEIGNPVTGIDCLAQNLLYDLNHSENNSLPDDGQEMLEEIRLQTKRITNIVQSLMGFSRAGKAEKEFAAVNLRACVDESIKLIQLGNKQGGIELENHCMASHLILGDEQQMIQIFVNLLSNAIDSSPWGSSVTIESRHAGSKILISVIDEGSGIPEHMLPNIFDPFVTTKDPGKGTGLGLSLVHSIIEDHGGSISIQNWSHHDTSTHTLHSGARVNISLPVFRNQNTETP